MIDKPKRAARPRWGGTKPSDYPPDKMSFRLDEAEIMTGLSRATLYREMKDGHLITFKVRGTTLISREALQAFLGNAAAGAAQAA